MGLSGSRVISGRLTVAQFDLDPLIAAALHLKQLTGHSSADGIFTISGAARDLDTIEVNADITRISFDYELVQLANDQDIHVAYRRNEVRIVQAHIHGADTDFQLAGSARFDRDRPLRFTLTGGVNLQLVKGLLPDLKARGRAEANISIEGTMSRPRITGRATVRDAAATYGDFPVGLSKMNGDLLFDKTRLVFDRIDAESGGGQLLLGGSVTYGEGPLRYDVSATTSVVRVRYPAGMSWLVGGNIQLVGNQDRRSAKRARAGAAPAVRGRRGSRLVFCLLFGNRNGALPPLPRFCRISSSTWKGKRPWAPGSNGAARRSRWMETSACAEPGAAPCCWGTFTCSAARCLSAGIPIS